MFKLFKTRKGGEIALNMDRIDGVAKSSTGQAIVFYAGGDEGVVLDCDFYEFISNELGVE